jgi:DNA-directed RNA polymerase specialized sigma24 family protein
MGLNPEPSPEDLAAQHEMANLLFAAVRKLPRPLQEVFLICSISEVGVKQAAARLGLSMPAAKTRLFRAQHKLQSEMRRTLTRPDRSKAAVEPICHVVTIDQIQVAA